MMPATTAAEVLQYALAATLTRVQHASTHSGATANYASHTGICAERHDWAQQIQYYSCSPCKLVNLGHSEQSEPHKEAM